MSKSGGFLLGAFIGASAAAVTALLFAPKSGKELREDLVKEADRYKEQLSEYGEIARAKGVEFAEVAKTSTQDIRINLQEQASHLKEQVSKHTENLKDQFNETVDKVKGNFAKHKEESAEVVAELAENVKEKAEDVKEKAEDVKEEA